MGCVLAVGACSRGVLSTVLDLPPEAPAPVDSVSIIDPAMAALFRGPLFTVADTVRPPIEAFLDPDTVIALLPRDHAGNIDWMGALQEGIISPRATAPGEEPDYPNPDPFEFKYDFFLEGPDTLLNAFFPHSAHTQWVDCQQCHARIFPYRNTPVTMGEIFQGKYCGECHGKVAFPVLTACERCHVNLALPPDRAQPELIGTITMQRAETARDSATIAADTRQFVTGTLPPAQFPHWVHRIRYQCKVCHMAIFEPQAGSNTITMSDINAGGACGTCHNGLTAFAAGFGECQRCHVPQASTTGRQ